MFRIAALSSCFGLKLSPENGRVVKDGAWIAAGQIASVVGTVIGVRMLTELVPPRVFGSVGLFVGILTLASNLFCSPFLQAAFRFFADGQTSGTIPRLRVSITHLLNRSTLILSALLLFGGLIYVYATGVSYWIFIALAGLLVVDVRRGIEANFLSAARRQRPFALLNAADACARPLLAVVAVAIFGATPGVVLMGYLIGSATVMCCFLLTSQLEGIWKSASEKPVEDFELTRDIQKYSFPLVPLAIVGWLSSLSDRYLIGGLIGLEQVGIYAAAFSLVSKPFLMAGGIVGNTLRPVYFHAVSNGNKEREVKTLRAWILASVGIFSLGVILISVFREPIVCFLLAKEYRASAKLLPWMAVGCSFLYLSHIYNSVSLAYMRSSSVLLSESSAALATIIIGLPMIWKFGLIGATISMPFCFVTQLLTSWTLSRRYISLRTA